MDSATGKASTTAAAAAVSDCTGAPCTLGPLVQRLEVAVARLERLGVSTSAHSAAGAVAATETDTATHALTERIKKLLPLLDELNELEKAEKVQQGVAVLRERLARFAELVAYPLIYKAVPDAQFKALIAPLLKKLPFAAPRGPQQNMFAALEAVFELF